MLQQSPPFLGDESAAYGHRSADEAENESAIPHDNQTDQSCIKERFIKWLAWWNFKDSGPLVYPDLITWSVSHLVGSSKSPNSGIVGNSYAEEEQWVFPSARLEPEMDFRSRTLMCFGGVSGNLQPYFFFFFSLTLSKWWDKCLQFFSLKKSKCLKFQKRNVSIRSFRSWFVYPNWLTTKLLGCYSPDLFKFLNLTLRCGDKICSFFYTLLCCVLGLGHNNGI